VACQAFLQENLHLFFPGETKAQEKGKEKEGQKPSFS
jgi:hypothetical protein